MNRSVCLSAILTLAFTACSKEAAPAGGTPPAEAPAAGTLLVEGNDTMQYTVKQLTVKAGQQVKIVFKNIGSLPKAAMGHNLVVLKPGVTAAGFGMQVTTSGKGNVENGYLPEEFMKDVIAHTKLLGPGEHDTIEFMAPATPGTLEYVCTFPGHFGVMNGKITVQ